MQTNMHEAKSKLSQLVEAALLGEEVIIARAGAPAVQLVPCKPKVKRTFGAFKGSFSMSSDFDSAETNNEVADMFGV